MEGFERQLALDYLVSSEERLLETVAGLTEEQWKFKEVPGRWSIGEIVEHLALFEDFIRDVVERALLEPPEANKAGASRGKEILVMGLATNRDVKLIARDAVRPFGRWPEMADVVDAFRIARQRSIELCRETEADLRERFFRHIALGDLDCYQWLLLLSQHTLRHVLQIEEIRAHRDYPILPKRR